MKLAAALLMALPVFAQSTNLAGDWALTIVRFGEPNYLRWKIESKDGHYSGRFFGMQMDGTAHGNTIEFACTYKEDDETKECGKLTGKINAEELRGDGKLRGDAVTWSAKRVMERAAAPRTHDYVPKEFHRQFNGNIPPVLHINSGDTVRTKCVDAGGVDETGTRRSLGGNPLTGPFYVEDALPGDTLVVKLNRVRLNRDTAGIFNDSVVAGALEPYYVRDQKREKDFDSSWKLDRQSGTASLSKPTGHLKEFKIKLQPMLGCVAVAPPNRQAFQSGNLGRYGGNMDYNQFREGTTLYFPVSQPGALLFVGDGHAAQGDGELTGNALETSMDVEFTVNVIRGKSLGQPRAENDEYIMVSGIAGSLNDALQMATTGMSRWLEQEYKLTTGEIAMVLGSSMRYDIAEIVDPQVHVVAKLSKSVLAQIPKP
ncbi:MAG: acetamidase/formamidase family protein [Bryobacteraceae bacterium]